MIFYVTKEKRLFQDLEGVEVTDNIQLVLNYFKDKEEVPLDTETEGFDPYTDKVLLYQLGDFDNQFVVDNASYPLFHVKALLEDNSKVILMQNAKFDLRFLYVVGIIPSNIYDTYLAEAVLFTGIRSARKGLGHLAKKYCNVELDKSIRRVIHYEGASLRVIKYAADDVKYLRKIKEKQEVELKRKDLTRALSLDNIFVKVLAYIEHCGIYLDKDLWKIKMLKDTKNYEESKNALDNWIVENNLIKFINPQLDLFNPERSCSINWASSKQVIPLMQSFGVDTSVIDDKTGKLKDSVETKVLKKQQDKTELISIYLSFKAAEKRVSTYGQNFIDVINPVTGRIHSSFTQILATGRMSSGGRLGSNKTVNVQNIPAEAETRACFTNQEEHMTLVNGDYSAMESVVFTNWSEEPGLIKFYKEDLGDMHSYISQKIFTELSDLTLKEIKEKHPDKRQIAKTAGFAIIFGGEGPTIAENVNITVEEGDKIYDGYIKAFPKFKTYANKVLNKALATGYIQFNTVSGRKAFIDYFEDFKSLEKSILAPGFWDNYRWHKAQGTLQFDKEFRPLVKRYFKKKSQIGRMALNYPIQGSSAEIMKLACIYFFKYIMDNNFFNRVLISNVVHDELLVECPEGMAYEISEKLQECMENAGERFCKIIPLKAVPKITKSWQH